MPDGRGFQENTEVEFPCETGSIKYGGSTSRMAYANNVYLLLQIALLEGIKLMGSYL